MTAPGDRRALHMKRFLRATLHRCEHATCWAVALTFTGILHLFAKLNRWLEDTP